MRNYDKIRTSRIFGWERDDYKMGLTINMDILAIVCGILGLLGIILLIWNITLSVKLGKVKKQFRGLVTGTSGENLEEILNGLFDRMREMDESNVEMKKKQEQIIASFKNFKGRMGIVRFSAYENQGSDLSFSIALIDDSENGVVLTSLFGRDDSRIYAKPVEKGDSVYTLSDEEKKAIAVASENRLSNL